MEDSDIQRLAARLDKVEELQSFADRTAEQLSEQMVALERNLREVDGRLRRLEERLGQLDERVERIPLPPERGTGLPPGADDPQQT
jgi:uncharacterized coiled-coil protein SlyX